MISPEPSGLKSGDRIISGKSGRLVSFDDLIEDLKSVNIIYVGESHTNTNHHEIQLKIVKAIHAQRPISIGMEMFDHTYQSILDEWSSGSLEIDPFIRKVHWYANWKFDFDLYKEILLFIKENRIPLAGLNIPFHIPAKIAVGGIENLSEEDRKHIPTDIDLSNSAHRQYLETIFQHHHIKGRDNFEDFYMTQCVWEEGMAEAISRHAVSGRIMIVLIGNGHILHHFGVPDRAFKRTGSPFRSIYLTTVGASYELSYGDYIWMTQSP